MLSTAESAGFIVKNYSSKKLLQISFPPIQYKCMFVILKSLSFLRNLVRWMTNAIIDKCEKTSEKKVHMYFFLSLYLLKKGTDVPFFCLCTFKKKDINVPFFMKRACLREFKPQTIFCSHLSKFAFTIQ